MPLFRVTITAHAEIDVEADDEEAASMAAMDEFQHDQQWATVESVEAIEGDEGGGDDE